jgi:chromosome segregation ATPase
MSTEAERRGLPRTVARNEASAKSAPATTRRGVRNPATFAEKKERLLALVAVLVRRGAMTPDELAKALGQPSALEQSEELKILQQRLSDLSSELRLTQLSREFLEDEVEVLESALGRERGLVNERSARIAQLEGQLADTRRTTLKLITTSRTSLTTLKKVRNELVSERFAQSALNPLVRDLQEMAIAVQELHALAVVKAATGSMQPPNG